LPGPDGVLYRRGARVIVVDDAERVLLLHGSDPYEPSSTWWFTVGGGIGPDEDERAAAVREAFEETGLRIEPADLVGPVFDRSAVFPYFGQVCRQDEVFFLYRVAANPQVSRDGWTDVERASVDEIRWWALDEFDAAEPVYPPDLRDLVRSLLVRGWDGVTRTIS
jgi:8-oxo-dGTP pyrophosphatase MutT (NUDIX family)